MKTMVTNLADRQNRHRYLNDVVRGSETKGTIISIVDLMNSKRNISAATDMGLCLQNMEAFFEKIQFMQKHVLREFRNGGIHEKDVVDDQSLADDAPPNQYMLMPSVAEGCIDVHFFNICDDTVDVSVTSQSRSALIEKLNRFAVGANRYFFKIKFRDAARWKTFCLQAQETNNTVARRTKKTIKRSDLLIHRLNAKRLEKQCEAENMRHLSTILKHRILKNASMKSSPLRLKTEPDTIDSHYEIINVSAHQNGLAFRLTANQTDGVVSTGRPSKKALPSMYIGSECYRHVEHVEKMMSCTHANEFKKLARQNTVKRQNYQSTI